MSISFANRGMAFEELINYSNNQYQAKGIALVQKVSTPWKVIRQGKQIISAFPNGPSTVDYIGTYQSKPIAFDAKETREKGRFPLSNIEPHQIIFLEQWQEHGGESFFLLSWLSHNLVMKVPVDYVRRYWDRAKGGGRKSIPFEDLKDIPIVKSARGIALDYLQTFG